jgi:hypothetical protein
MEENSWQKYPESPKTPKRTATCTVGLKGII